MEVAPENWIHVGGRLGRKFRWFTERYPFLIHGLSLSIGAGSLLYVQDRLLCLGDQGHLLWLDVSPEGAQVVARASLFQANQTWAPPVVSQGLLYVCQNTRERFGKDPSPPRLLCFDLRASTEK